MDRSTRRSGRLTAALAAAVLATGLVVAAGVAQAGTGQTGTGPVGAGQVSAEDRRPGVPVFVEPLPVALWLRGTGAAYRIRYTSTGFDGRSVVVAGAVFVPAGPAPRAGWPVVSWAHGTVGVADGCAQSVAGRSDRDVKYLTTWLSAGYAVVATEYEGLGVPGPHPYLHGGSEARGVIDMVRAAVRVDSSISSTWLAVGQSQGGQAALFAGAMAPTYAPELDYRGAIATAPPTQWRTTIEVADPFEPTAPANPFGLLMFEGLRATHSDVVEPATLLTALGLKLFTLGQQTLCFPALAQELAGRTAAEIYEVNSGEQERLTQLLEQDADVPIVAHHRPVYIAQGTADTVVYPPASKTTADQLAAAGTDRRSASTPARTTAV